MTLVTFVRGHLKCTSKGHFKIGHPGESCILILYKTTEGGIRLVRGVSSCFLLLEICLVDQTFLSVFRCESKLKMEGNMFFTLQKCEFSF